MIKTLAFLLLCATASANILTFTGKIDSVPNGLNLFKVNDPVMFKLTYNPATMIITRAVVSSGESDFVFYGNQGHIYIDADPTDGSVLWQAPESDNFDIALGTGIAEKQQSLNTKTVKQLAAEMIVALPCIGDFTINDFTITLGANVCAQRFTVHGHLTSIP